MRIFYTLYVKHLSVYISDAFDLKLGLGVGIPLFLLACTLVGVVIYYIYGSKARKTRRWRRALREQDSSDSCVIFLIIFNGSRIWCAKQGGKLLTDVTETFSCPMLVLFYLDYNFYCITSCFLCN